MKTRESGMPAEELWESFFDPGTTLSRLGLTKDAGEVAEFGCGYGTFTLAAAKVTCDKVHAFDIERDMVERTRQRVAAAGHSNVCVHLRDFVAEGTGLADESVGYTMLFNILHAENPAVLLSEAHRIIAPGGRLGIMHWNHDPSTPRGPSMEIRPRAEQCLVWAENAGFHLLSPGVIDLPPYHYGMCLEKRRA